METLKLLTVEFDLETQTLTGVMSEKISNLLSEEQVKEVVDAMTLVADAFSKDMESKGCKLKEKVRSYEPIQEEEQESELPEGLEFAGMIAKAMGIDKEKFFVRCLKDIDELIEQTGKSEEETIITLKKALDKMFE